MVLLFREVRDPMECGLFGLASGGRSLSVLGGMGSVGAIDLEGVAPRRASSDVGL